MTPAVLPTKALSSTPQHRLVRRVGTLFLALLLIGGALYVLRRGVALQYAATTQETSPITWGASWRPADPDVNAARARAVLTQNPAVARAYLEAAVTARPDDYFLWLSLAHARARTHDQNAALTAYQEATRLAPYYAQPAWRWGLSLYEAGQRDTGTALLRRAASREPILYSQLVDLLWDEADADPSVLLARLPPQTPPEKLMLASFFVPRGFVREALDLYCALSGVPEIDRQGFIRSLREARAWHAAYEVWDGSCQAAGVWGRNGLARFDDGGFEAKYTGDTSGFAWQLTGRTKFFQPHYDTAQTFSGNQSVQFVFNGTPPSVPFLSQIVLVEPRTHYRVSFAARTENLLTGAAPLLLIRPLERDAHSDLAQTPKLATGTAGWSRVQADFFTGDNTTAVDMIVTRSACADTVCPIFGTVWLDDFTLDKF